jgi:hypothetical protein
LLSPKSEHSTHHALLESQHSSPTPSLEPNQIRERDQRLRSDPHLTPKAAFFIGENLSWAGSSEPDRTAKQKTKAGQPASHLPSRPLDQAHSYKLGQIQSLIRIPNSSPTVRVGVLKPAIFTSLDNGNIFCLREWPHPHHLMILLNIAHTLHQHHPPLSQSQVTTRNEAESGMA